MSISGINSSSAAYPSTSTGGLQQRRQDIDALAQSLQSGDLSGAQQAFSALTKNAPIATGAAPQGAQTGTSATDFTQLAQALQSGDLSGAQKAFAALKQDVQTAQQSGRQQGGQVHAHHHGGHHHAAATQTATVAPAAADTAGSSGSAGTGNNSSVSGSNIDVAV